MKKIILINLFFAILTISFITGCKKKAEDPEPSPETEQVKTPVFEPGSGNYPNSVTVTLTCATEGASIYYTIDGTEPDNTSTIYSEPVKLYESTTLKARAYKDNYNPSEISSAEYTITRIVETPVFEPGSGNYQDSVSVTLTCATEGASIYYTIDGTEPDNTSTIYSEPVKLYESTTLKARAYKDNYNPSEISSAEYTIILEPVANPVFDPQGGTFNEPVYVNISCATEGASIYYTLDGTEPDNTSTIYSEPVIIYESTTLKARAYKDNYNPSEINSAEYTIILEPVADPVFDPQGGTFNEPVIVNISCATEGASIYYTLDGTEPDNTSFVYLKPIRIYESTTIKAKAFKPYYEPSGTVTETYTLQKDCEGSLSVTYNEETNEYVLTECLLKGTNEKITIKFITENDQIYSEISLRSKEILTGTFTFEPFGSIYTGCLYEDGGEFIFTKGELTITHIENNNYNYNITFNEVTAVSENSIIPVRKYVSLNFTGTIF